MRNEGNCALWGRPHSVVVALYRAGVVLDLNSTQSGQVYVMTVTKLVAYDSTEGFKHFFGGWTGHIGGGLRYDEHETL